VLTRRHSLDLISRFSDSLDVHDVARSLGFDSPPATLDAVGAHALGVVATASMPRLAIGRGAMRALIVHIAKEEPLRPIVAKIAQRLTARAPHQLWTIIATREDGGEGAIATCQPQHGRARVCALVLAPARPLESDAETLMALVAAHEGGAAVPDALLYARWCEILGRDALSHRFYRALERGIVALGEGARGSAPQEARQALALLTTSRLVFLSFLQGKGWLDGDADFLANRLDATLGAGGDVHHRFFDPLFFGTLNTPPARRAAGARAFGVIPFLNGGLFARSSLERRYGTLRFRDEEIAGLFDDVLTRYRFTAREEQPEWSEAAIDPEMLGRAFESLMASRERRDSGAYYTPHALVARLCEAVLDEVGSDAGISAVGREALRDGDPVGPNDSAIARAAYPTLRILDPACGTGAFLVHLLERLALQLRRAGDPRADGVLRRELLTHSIFGVDINPMAVWLCELRLWLSVVIELPDGASTAVPPLPNLDRNVRVGDALAGGSFQQAKGHASGSIVASRALPIEVLRARYVRATGARKHSLARRLDSAGETRSPWRRRSSTSTPRRRTPSSRRRGARSRSVRGQARCVRRGATSLG
jgi:hypothetical protein